jgi:hypothetical protein
MILRERTGEACTNLAESNTPRNSRKYPRRLVCSLGVRILRGDEVFLAKPFMEKVWDGICAARLVLADCTEKNPNVFYEIGMAHTVGKKVVLVTRSDKDIPSDIKHFDYVPGTPFVFPGPAPFRAPD